MKKDNIPINSISYIEILKNKPSEIAHWSPQIVLVPVTGPNLVSIIWGDQWAISDALFFSISVYLIELINTRKMEGLENAVVLALVVFLFALEIFFYSHRSLIYQFLCLTQLLFLCPFHPRFPSSADVHCPVSPLSELEQLLRVSGLCLVPAPCLILCLLAAVLPLPCLCLF